MILDVKPAESTAPQARTGPGPSSKECSCEEQEQNNLVQTSSQIVSSTNGNQPPEMRFAEVPHPQQYADDQVQIAEKTVCITPTVIQRIVKATLAYVTQMPLELNTIVDQIDQEINKMSVTKTKQESIVRQSTQMLNQPRSQTRTNLVVKYDQPGEQTPNCVEALEKLIEIAYKAYLEIEHQPQCRDYLYQFASTYKEDRPRGYLENGQPDMKSLIVTIIEEIQKQRSIISTPSSESDRYGGFEVPTHNVQTYTSYTSPVNQVIEHTISPVPNRVPKTQTIQISEHTYPQPQVVTVPPLPPIPPPPPSYQVVEHTISPIPNQTPSMQTVNEYTYPHPQTVTLQPPPQSYQVVEHTISPIPNQAPNIQTSQIHEYTYPQPQTVNRPPPPPPPPPPAYHVVEHTISPLPNQVPNTQTLQINEYPYPQPPKIPLPPSPPVKHVIEHITISPVPSRLPKTQTVQLNEYSYPHPQTATVPPAPPAYQVFEQITISPVPSRLPKTQTLQINEHTYPRPQMVTLPPLPPIHEETIMTHTYRPMKPVPNPLPIKPIQPEEIMNLLVKLIKTSDQPNNGKVYEHIIKLVDLNANIFRPQLLKQITTVLKIHKQHNVPRVKELLLCLLNSQRQPQTNDIYTETLLTYLQPNHSGQYDSRLVDVLLYLVNTRPSISEVEYILSLLNPFMSGLPTEGDYADITFNCIRQIQTKVLTQEQTSIILTLLTPYLPDLQIHSTQPAVVIAKELSKWNGVGITPKQFNIILNILNLTHPNGGRDQRAIDIVYFLLTNGHRLMPKSIEVILTILSPQNGIIDYRRLDLIHIIFNELIRSPKHGLLLLSLVIENGPNILNSNYVDILILLKQHHLITIELLDVLVKLLNDEIYGQLDNSKIQTLIYRLEPHRQRHEKLVNDILILLYQSGINIAQLMQPQQQEPEQAPVHVVYENTETHISPSIEFSNEYRTPDGGYQTIEETNVITPISPTNPKPEDDLVQIFTWLESHGLLNPDQTSNNELVNKILKILQLGERELGVLELTYMLKHAKPLIYQPVYYVKYRLPILSFISNMKTLLVENPNLNADPMKLLQELIVVSNVTEVSPNLQGFPKDEILKLTLYDGDLIQAKILDEQNMSLNEQITYVHTLNADISPEELLHLNEVNEAKFFPNLIQMNDPSKLTVLSNTIDKFVEFPPVQYKHVITSSNPGVTHETHTVHQTYIERTNQQTTPQSVPQTLILPIK
ncbi:hypothetical protein SFRURICE_009461 [Spodoptera frugiperda]|nr:hypothetical protein SFRURICE_009461 [Spodoptera frugiperda]